MQLDISGGSREERSDRKINDIPHSIQMEQSTHLKWGWDDG